MSEALEARTKNQPPGRPDYQCRRSESRMGKKDPHAEAKRQKIVTPEYMFHEAPRTKEFITGSEAAKEASGVRTSISLWPIRSRRRAKPCSWSECSMVKAT